MTDEASRISAGVEGASSNHPSETTAPTTSTLRTEANPLFGIVGVVGMVGVVGVVGVVRVVGSARRRPTVGDRVLLVTSTPPSVMPTIPIGKGKFDVSALGGKASDRRREALVGQLGERDHAEHSGK